MSSTKSAARVYLLNAVVLTAHEIDSAFWHEWELFRLPGGIQLFLVLNILLLGIVFWGYRAVVLWTPSARAYSYLLASAGLFAALVHGVFLAAGTPHFRLPVSLGLLATTLLLSTWQIIVASRASG